MNQQNKDYLDACLKTKDLLVFGIYDETQNYAIMHKWGSEKDIEVVIKSMKAGMKKCGLKDKFIVFKYPDFSVEDLHDFLDRSSAFWEFCKTHRPIAN